MYNTNKFLISRGREKDHSQVTKAQGRPFQQTKWTCHDLMNGYMHDWDKIMNDLQPHTHHEYS